MLSNIFFLPLEKEDWIKYLSRFKSLILQTHFDDDSVQAPTFKNCPLCQPRPRLSKALPLNNSQINKKYHLLKHCVLYLTCPNICWGTLSGPQHISKSHVIFLYKQRVDLSDF